MNVSTSSVPLRIDLQSTVAQPRPAVEQEHDRRAHGTTERVQGDREHEVSRNHRRRARHHEALERFHAERLQSSERDSGETTGESTTLQSTLAEVEHEVRSDLRSLAKDIRHRGRGVRGSNRENAHLARELNHLDRDFRHALREAQPEGEEGHELDPQAVLGTVREAFDGLLDGLAEVFGLETSTGEGAEGTDPEGGTPLSASAPVEASEVVETPETPVLVNGEPAETDLAIDASDLVAAGEAQGEPALAQAVADLRTHLEEHFAELESLLLEESEEASDEAAEEATAQPEPTGESEVVARLYLEAQTRVFEAPTGEQLDAAA